MRCETKDAIEAKGNFFQACVYDAFKIHLNNFKGSLVTINSNKSINEVEMLLKEVAHCFDFVAKCY